MALTKKQREELLELPIFEDENNQKVFSETNEKTVLKALEDFEDNEVTVSTRLQNNEEKLFRLTTLCENNKEVAKKLQVRLLTLEEEINSDKGLLKNWIEPTIQMLNNKYLSFVEAKYSQEIDEYIKEVEEE